MSLVVPSTYAAPSELTATQRSTRPNTGKDAGESGGIAEFDLGLAENRDPADTASPAASRDRNEASGGKSLPDGDADPSNADRAGSNSDEVSTAARAGDSDARPSQDDPENDAVSAVGQGVHSQAEAAYSARQSVKKSGGNSERPLGKAAVPGTADGRLANERQAGLGVQSLPAVQQSQHLATELMAGAKAEAASQINLQAGIADTGTSGSGLLTEPGRLTFGELSGSRPTLQLNTPAGQPGWHNEIGGHLRWLISQGVRVADLRLNPPELGAVEVRIATEGDRSSVTFFASNAQTRELIESALPRLREMFEQQGLQLADAGVFGDQQRQASQNDESNANLLPSATGREVNTDSGAFAPTGESGVAMLGPASLVDFYI